MCLGLMIEFQDEEGLTRDMETTKEEDEHNVRI